MKRGLFGGIFLSLWLAAMPAWAQESAPVDTVTWLEGDYIGVGGIDVPKFVQRRIYTYLMDFFVTDSGVKTALETIRSSGIVMENILKRIVFGMPVDIERSEHIILWETSETLMQYKAILGAHSSKLDVRQQNGVEYFATKRENECLAILGNVLVLGSERKVRAVIDAYQKGYKGGPSNPELHQELKRADKTKDAWFAFVLGDKERKFIGRGDPIVDMRAGGLGVLNFGDILRGNASFDFSKGLNVQGNVGMVSETSAKQASGVIQKVLLDAASDADVKASGFDKFIGGIKLGNKKSDMQISVVYNQGKFDELIAAVTQFMKNVPGQNLAAPVVQVNGGGNEVALQTQTKSN